MNFGRFSTSDEKMAVPKMFEADRDKDRARDLLQLTIDRSTAAFRTIGMKACNKVSRSI